MPLIIRHSNFKDVKLLKMCIVKLMKYICSARRCTKGTEMTKIMSQLFKGSRTCTLMTFHVLSTNEENVKN